jgi:peptidoglycan hydrolase CwlO-like protein
MSFEGIGAVVTFLVGLGTLTVLIAGTYVLFRASLSKARINALREDNEDLRHRVDDQDKELLKCAARETALEVKVEHLDQENKLLQALVTSKADVETLKEEVARLFKELTKHHNEVMPVMTAIRDNVSKR